MFRSFFAHSRAALQIFAICLAFLFLPACDQDVVLNLDHTVNVFHPGPKWPNLKKLSPPQQEAYKQYGRPDCFRILWNPQGDLKVRTELEKELKGKKPKDLPPYTWVYTNRNVELVFRGASHTEQPISEQAKLVIQYGDPEDVKQIPGGVTQWTFYSVGKSYNFYQGRIVETKEFPAMGTFIK